MTSSFQEDLAAVFRKEGPAVTASLVRMCRDFDAAEDALQEAFTIAASQWHGIGVPANPGGRIMTTAKRHDRLTLIFTCCHPALGLENRVVLTLRTICGLTTEEIAAAFLVSSDTMAKRLVRAALEYCTAISLTPPGPQQESLRRALEEFS